MSARIGSLFSGYGGLDMGVTAALGGTVAWHVEYDAAPSKILAHHWPDIPNYGDVTAVDWQAIEPVDVLTGGSPCQDLSHAGRRAGMTEGTRSNLWVAMREAIAQLRPTLVVWENVRGAYSAGADSALEFCPGCMGEAWDRGPVLRALGRVLGDLSDLGYDARWHGLRAADVGAPHGRFRVFVVAYPAGNQGRFSNGDDGASTFTDVGGREWGQAQLRGAPVHAAGDGAGSLLPTPSCSDTNGAGQHGDGGLDLRTAVSLLPTPRATDGTHGGPNQRGSSGDLMLPSAVHLLPTPAVNDMGAAYTPDEWDAWTDRMKAEHGNGNGHGKSLSIEAQRLLPTPTTQPTTGNGHARHLGGEARLLQTPSAADGLGGHERRGGQRGEELLLNGQAKVMHGAQWGDYAPAIHRWEATLGRPAPAPTELGPKGTPRLSAAFVEWMMGLPAGHVTDVPGLTRNHMLKALGNGVVPQQAEAALRTMLGWAVAA